MIVIHLYPKTVSVQIAILWALYSSETVKPLKQPKDQRGKMKSKSTVIKSQAPSIQIIEEDYTIGVDGIIEPFVSFDLLRSLYASNLYHQRAIKIKAGLLSQIKKTNIQKYIPINTNPKSLLNKLILNLEVYGSAFLEKAGLDSDFNLYNMNTHNTRVDKDGNIYQNANYTPTQIEAWHLKYDSILSEFYGEPDYITIIRQISTLFKADVYNDKFFDNGGKPELAFIFEDSTPSEGQVEAITSFLKNGFKGYNNAHKSIVLYTGQGDGQSKPKIRIEEIGKVEDLSFQKLKEVGRDEIATAHGTPPRLLGIVQGNGLGGSGELIAQMKMFLKTTIEPKINTIEYFFNQHGIELEIERFDLDSLQSNEDVADQLVSKGIISPIEKRDILGY